MLIINQSLMKAKITAARTKIIASVFSMCTAPARCPSQLLWQQCLCFPQYPSLIIYTQEKESIYVPRRNDAPHAASARLLTERGTKSGTSSSAQPLPPCSSAASCICSPGGFGLLGCWASPSCSRGDGDCGHLDAHLTAPTASPQTRAGCTSTVCERTH